jgi:hypothetical protein
MNPRDVLSIILQALKVSSRKTVQFRDGEGSQGEEQIYVRLNRKLVLAVTVTELDEEIVDDVLSNWNEMPVL